MSAPSLFRNPAIWGVAFLAIACAATATFLPLLNGLSPLFYDPEDLPRSERDPRVHFEAGANFCAAEVAALLPRAIQHVEAMQGRPFARDPVVAVYSSPALFAKANGFGHPNVAGASQWGRITLSPRLCTTERPRLAAVLTHELSHAHLLSWRSWYVFERPPSWFSEGLAVMVSGGGGAEGVDEDAAAQALLRGYAIAIQHKGRWLDFAAIPFRIEPLEPSIPRQRLAYRQAAMFSIGSSRGVRALFINFCMKSNPASLSPPPFCSITACLRRVSGRTLSQGLLKEPFRLILRADLLD